VLGKIVDANIREWMKREESFIKRQREKELAEPLPLITISRDRGSGGGKIAKFLAEKTGFTLIDKEFLEHIAKRAEVRKEVVAMVEEKARQNVFRWLTALRKTERLTSNEYFNHLLEVVAAISQLGGAVLVGRGANFILEPKTALRVRIVCPLAVRIQKFVEADKITPQSARKNILKKDDERKAFVAEWFRKDIDNPEYYDLEINTNFLDIETAAALILHAYNKKFNLPEKEIGIRLARKSEPQT